MLAPPSGHRRNSLTKADWRDLHDQARAHTRIKRATAVSTVKSRNGIRAGDRLRPACQAWGGPRALNGRWSNVAGSLAANDHRNVSVNKLGARILASIGRIRIAARAIFAQMAQKSPASPTGFFCGDGTSAEASLVSVAAHAAEPPLNLPT